MAQNVLKNEFLWEEQKKKKRLYKNWKLYATALGIITVGLSVGLGVGLGIHNEPSGPIAPVNLNNLGLNTTLTTPYTNEQEALNAFLTLNSTVIDLKDNVEVETFTTPTYATFGSLAIKAKENSKYIGTITISIPKLAQTNLNQMITTKTISGEGITTENQALQAVAKTIGWSNLSDFAEVETFTTATYASNGSLTITAKANTMYTGSVTITITKLTQTDLSSLKLNTTLTTPYTNQQAAFDAFLSLNSTVTDLKDNVEVETFTTPTYATFGSLAIKAKENSKYIGTITISIPKLAQTNLNQMITTKTISGEGITTENQALQTVAKTIGWPNLSDFAEVETFTTATYTTDGSLTITAKENNIYTGSVTITITKLTQTNLNTLKLNTTLTTPYTNEQEAFDAFLSLNSTVTDLKDNIEVGTFTTPTYTLIGKLTVNAKTNSKYIGTIDVTINAIGQTQLSDLNLTTTISGTENITPEGVLQMFIGTNNQYPDLADNVTFDENSFTAPTSTSPGKLTVNAIANGKYIGTIELTIEVKEIKEIITIVTSFIPYEIKISAGTTYNQLIAKIDANFIKEALPDWVKSVFINTEYTLGNLALQGNQITNGQLSQPGTIKNIDINYNYNNYTGGSSGNRTFLTVIIE